MRQLSALCWCLSDRAFLEVYELRGDVVNCAGNVDASDTIHWRRASAVRPLKLRGPVQSVNGWHSQSGLTLRGMCSLHVPLHVLATENKRDVERGGRRTPAPRLEG